MPRPVAQERITLPETADWPALPLELTCDRWRSIRITVRPDGAVLVKAPFRARRESVLDAVQRKRGWIEAKRRFFRERGLPPPRLWAEGEILYYVGQSFRLRFDAQGRAGRRRGAVALLRGRELVIRPGNAPLTPDLARRAVEAWRQSLAESLFRRRLARLYARYAGRLGVPCPALRVRSLKRRWGSCSARGVVTLARQLSAAPLACVDYVIVHELCHLRHMNHGPRFHALLEELLPGAARLAKELQRWGLEHGRE
ncbi:MAG: M48 family metallopeptidase [Desulfovibrionaceae bacterium]|nr:M48 family metallopeptidase [Desulfovibrionaceae bacterium]